jgi:methylenetetrahydrofolate dehydrogenase (NADP+)/methenyltetrahydrofolate cyclohydrolase
MASACIVLLPWPSMSLASTPAHPAGILRLLDAYDVPLSGMHAVVVGRSPILGKPIGMLLLARDATVTYCHSRTVDLSDRVRQADVVVAAVGRAPN